MFYHKIGRFPELIFGTTSIKEGILTSAKSACRDTKEIASNLGFRKSVLAGMVHKTGIWVVSETTPQIVQGTDSLITNTQGIMLSLYTADCCPVFFWDPRMKVIGIAHAGWRGVVGNISSFTAEMMMGQFKCSPDDIEVHFGPAIQKCCFEVKNDKNGLVNFKKYSDFVSNSNDRICVDLQGIMKYQLSGLGVRNITSENICTYCDPEALYPSHRRDKNDLRMMSVAGIKPIFSTL